MTCTIKNDTLEDTPLPPPPPQKIFFSTEPFKFPSLDGSVEKNDAPHDLWQQLSFLPFFTRFV